MGMWEALRRGLARTRDRLVERLPAVWTGRNEIEGELAALEEALLSADVGPATSEKLVERMRAEARRDPALTPRESLRRAVQALLEGAARPLEVGPERPWVLFLLGVNGAGKTTLAGKLGAHFARRGFHVLLVAGDTFRAAAVDQLEVWAQRAGVELVRQRMGADPTAVVHDALVAAKARGTDVVLVDTAGRLHTKHNLMAELEKLARVAARLVPGAPHHNLLVLDATLGQNALEQARQFHGVARVTSLAVNKLDGTARGGAVLAIADQLGLPVSVLGLGEGIDDWGPLDAAEFAEALVG